MFSLRGSDSLRSWERQAGAWNSRLRAKEVCRAVAVAGDKSVAIVPEMTSNFPAELHIDPGAHTLFWEGGIHVLCCKPKGCMNEYRKKSIELYVDHLSANFTNSRLFYSKFPIWKLRLDALSGVLPTPHPVPCRVKHLLQNIVHSSSSHLSPQPTSLVSLKYL
jgi:hypothetical protein